MNKSFCRAKGGTRALLSDVIKKRQINQKRKSDFNNNKKKKRKINTATRYEVFVPSISIALQHLHMDVRPRDPSTSAD